MIINLKYQLKLFKFIPNFLTLCNALLGCLSILVLFNDFKIIDGFSSYELIVLFVLLASILDFLDGFLARALKSESKIGGQLDSFSDSITFGLVPSLVMFDFLYNKTGIFTVSFISLTIFICTILRLSKFNISEYQKDFIGLPSPASGLFFIGLPFITSKIEVMYFLIIILFISILMISNLKFYSLKNINSNEKKVFLILLVVTNLIAIGSALMFDISAFSITTIIILSYLISSSLSLLFNRLNSSS